MSNDPELCWISKKVEQTDRWCVRLVGRQSARWCFHELMVKGIIMLSRLFSPMWWCHCSDGRSFSLQWQCECLASWQPSIMLFPILLTALEVTALQTMTAWITNLFWLMLWTRNKVMGEGQQSLQLDNDLLGNPARVYSLKEQVGVKTLRPLLEGSEWWLDEWLEHGMKHVVLSARSNTSHWPHGIFHPLSYGNIL